MFNVLATGNVSSVGVAGSCRGATPAKTGTGVYTLTLDQALDATEGLLVVTPVGLADVRIAIAHTSDTVKTISTFSGAVGTAADSAFSFVAVQYASGNT